MGSLDQIASADASRPPIDGQSHTTELRLPSAKPSLPPEDLIEEQEINNKSRKGSPNHQPVFLTEAAENTKKDNSEKQPYESANNDSPTATPVNNSFDSPPQTSHEPSASKVQTPAPQSPVKSEPENSKSGEGKDAPHEYNEDRW